ncbi:MAG: hypothetical protein H0X24_01610 [Ktedonobacterales bacterium]|nr:hypothetical protein [Ktedonobacterales bacterium]
MPDLENRLPGRMVLAFALHPIPVPAACGRCVGVEPAVAHLMEFAPPPLIGDPSSPATIADLFERFVAEQARGIFRMGDFEPVGVQCLAARMARHQERADVATIAAALQSMALPERFMGAWAVAPGVDGKLFPMILGAHEPLSVAQMYLLINRPLGELDAGDEIIADPPQSGAAGAVG